MAYPQGSGAAAPTPQSLTGDMARLVGRLDEIHNRVVELANVLHGPQPREAAPKSPQGVIPDANFRRAVDMAHDLVGQIELELQHISARL